MDRLDGVLSFFAVRSYRYRINQAEAVTELIPFGDTQEM